MSQQTFSPLSHRHYPHPYYPRSTTRTPRRKPTCEMNYLKYNYPYTIPASECTDCYNRCTEPMCSTSGQFTSQCTDQCVIIACDDPEHYSLRSFDGPSNGDFICDNERDCGNCDFDALCYCDSHPRFAVQRQSTSFSQPHAQKYGDRHNNWGESMSAMLCDSRSSGGISSTPNASPLPSIAASPVFTPATGGNSHPYSSSVATYQSSSAEIYAQIPSSFYPALQRRLQELPAPQDGASHDGQQIFTAPSSAPSSPRFLTCMWGNCQARFTSLAELVGHVNLAHLRPPTDSVVSPDNNNPSAEVQLHTQQADDGNRFSCLWGNCNEYLQPQHLVGTSDNNVDDILLSSLASHLFQAHLGLQNNSTGTPQNSDLNVEDMLYEVVAPQQQAQAQEEREPRIPRFDESGPVAGTDIITGIPATPYQTPENTTTDLQPLTQEASTLATPSPRIATTTIGSPAVSSTETSSGEGHICRWQSCGMTFDTCDDLMSHISGVHVGSGKPQYDCLWEGCTRNGDRGFSSKQKICRHLQSHTGYRPFQCPECLQNFSEAATLQQHIRRHTQEKPYKCDFPGCGKSFAITGALTIHKRIHNGQKPFKCSYCGRGFAESSNLSKHLRTHTGERPYVCVEPGCGKAFARPDQLTRHAGVHRKVDVIATEV